MEELVLLEKRDGVATLVLNRPLHLNALSVEMMQHWRRAVESLAGDTAVEVVVVKGAGEHFMAGGDIKDFHAHLDLAPPDRLRAFQAMIEQWINPAVQAVQALHQPVIAQVRGACAGFGMSLMLGCDLAIAAEDALFTSAYAQLGVSGDGGLTWFLPRVAGRRRAMELMLLSERFDARQALELGLVNRVVPAADLDRETAALAARLQAGPRHAYGEIKRLLQASGTAPLAQQLQAEAEAFARCSATADFAEGVRAFVEKRRPKFSGR